MRVHVVPLLLSSALARPALTSSSESFSYEILEFVEHEKSLSDSSSPADVEPVSIPVADVDLASPATSVHDGDDDVLEGSNAIKQIIEKAKAEVASLKEQKEGLLAMIAEQEERLKHLLGSVDDQNDEDYPLIVEVVSAGYATDTILVEEGGVMSNSDLNVMIVILMGCSVFLLLISLAGLWALYDTLSRRRRRHSSRRADKIGHHHRRYFGRHPPRKNQEPGRAEQTLPLFQQDAAQQQWLHRQDKTLLSEKSSLVGDYVCTDEKLSSSESDRVTSIDDELAGLREIVGVVGDMVTAEEGRQASGSHAYVDDLPVYEHSHPGRPPSYKEQVSDDEDTH